MSSLSTLPKGDSAWLLRKAIERIIQQVSVLETNIGASTSGNSANTQVIFNDAGVLRGDPDLIFNKALNKLVATNLESTTTLVVGTSATITGDLTVASTVLKVVTSNVGIGTATPNTNANRTTLTLNNASWGGQLDINVGAVNHAQFGTDNFNSGLSCRIQSADGIVMKTAGNLLQQISSAGVFTFFDGAGGTRMTLNSTGLGIGVVPSALLHVQKSQNNDTTLIVNNTNSGAAASARLDLVCNANNSLTIQSYGQNYSGNVCGIAAAKLNTVLDNALTANSTGFLIGTVSTNPLYFATANAVKMILDSSGNVGIGVTPSAWDTSVFKAIQIGTGVGQASVVSRTDNVNNTAYGLNYYYGTGAYRYIAAGRATTYEQASGKHYWNIDSGTQVANAATSFTQAMTLDASGRLGIGTATPGGVLHTAQTAAAAYANNIFENTSATGYVALPLFVGAAGANGTCSIRYAPGVFAKFGPDANDTTTPIYFVNNNSTTRMEIAATGAGDVKINTGNVVMATSGKGIDFSAVTGGTGTATGNVLNDYEEGTFVPDVQGTTIGGTIATWYAQSGRYTKVGRVVTVQVYLAWGGGTGTGDLTFTGLPFAIGNIANNYTSGAIGYFGDISLTALNVPSLYAAPNTTKFTLNQFPVGGGGTTPVPYDSSGGIMFTATYFTA